MSNFVQTVAAGASVEMSAQADFLRLMKASGEVEFIYYQHGAEMARTGNVNAGYAERIRGGFDKVRVTDKSGAANTIEFVYRNGGDVRYDRAVGQVDVGIQSPVRSGTVYQGQNTVGVASAQLRPANAGRDYLLIQNQHATGKIYLNLAGNAAAIGSGILVPPGGSFEMNSNVITTAIFAIGDVANTAVVVVDAS